MNESYILKNTYTCSGLIYFYVIKTLNDTKQRKPHSENAVDFSIPVVVTE